MLLWGFIIRGRGRSHTGRVQGEFEFVALVLAAKNGTGGFYLGLANIESVGIGGHALHGGYGMSSRTHSLALDWVESLTVVLANATVVDCSAVVHPSLFFAMLGAGSSFGIATEFRFRTFEAPEVVTWFSATLPWDGIWRRHWRGWRS